MKRMTIAAFAGLMSLSAASAADIGLDKRADLYEPAPTTNTYFNGLAVGIDGGGQFTSWDIDTNPAFPFAFDGISSDGLIGGAHLEYLFAVDSFRLGAYAEGGFSNVNTTLEFGGFNAELQQDSYYGVGLKAGTTVYGSTLISIHGGYDWSQWTASSNIPGSSDIGADVGSWVIGGAIETMVADDWSLGLKGDYLMLHDADVEGFDATPFVEDSEMGRIKARLTRRF